MSKEKVKEIKELKKLMHKLFPNFRKEVSLKEVKKYEEALKLNSQKIKAFDRIYNQIHNAIKNDQKDQVLQKALNRENSSQAIEEFRNYGIKVRKEISKLTLNQRALASEVRKYYTHTK